MVEFEVKGISLQVETKPDLFSPKGLDQGTKLLLESVARETYQTALDWGCGWGAIALFAAKHQPAARIKALDSDIAAVSMTERNARLNKLENIEVIASYGFEEIDQDLRFDLILSNPPTHRGREIVESMVRQSAEYLKGGGKLIVVVEARISPWLKRTMAGVFGDYKIVTRGPKNVVLMSVKRAS